MTRISNRLYQFMTLSVHLFIYLLNCSIDKMLKKRMRLRVENNIKYIIN